MLHLVNSMHAVRQVWLDQKSIQSAANDFGINKLLQHCNKLTDVQITEHSYQP